MINDCMFVIPDIDQGLTDGQLSARSLDENGKRKKLNNIDCNGSRISGGISRKRIFNKTLLSFKGFLIGYNLGY